MNAHIPKKLSWVGSALLVISAAMFTQYVSSIHAESAEEHAAAIAITTASTTYQIAHDNTVTNQDPVIANYNRSFAVSLQDQIATNQIQLAQLKSDKLNRFEPILIRSRYFFFAGIIIFVLAWVLKPVTPTPRA